MRQKNEIMLFELIYAWEQANHRAGARQFIASGS
jgi:hypothetical protein